jgi:predicted DNA-binding transcriptional regulator YafY
VGSGGAASHPGPGVCPVRLEDVATTDRADLLISIAYTLMSTRYGYTRARLRELVSDYRDEPNQATFERRFERDKAALRKLGFDLQEITKVQADGPGEVRYRIDPAGYALPPLRFSTTEAALLGLASQVLHGGELGRQASRAARRLTAEVPGAEPTEDEAVGFSAQLDAGAPYLADLVRFCVASTPISFRYRAADGNEAKRKVVPWGLGHRDGHWYLAAGDMVRDDARLFRLDRIRSEPGPLSLPAEEYAREAYMRTDRFDMSAMLTRIGVEQPPRTATLLAQGVSGGAIGARADSRTETADGVELVVRYTVEESFAAEIAGEGLIVMEPPELATAVGQVLDTALAAQASPVPAYTVRKHAGGRRPIEAMVAGALDVLTYVSAHQDETGTGRVPLHDVSAAVGLDQEQLVPLLNRLMLCGLPGGMHHELLDVVIDDHGVRIDNAEALAQPMNLSVAEVSAVLIGLDALSSAPTGTLGDAAREAAADLARRLKRLRPDQFEDFDRIVAVTLASDALSSPASVIGEAIAAGQALEITYAGASGTTERAVEPVQLLDQDNRVYLKAWCRLRQAARVFRLDRIVALAPAGAERATTREHRDAALAMPVVPESGGEEIDLLFTGSWAERAEDYRPERVGTAKGESARVDGIDSVAARCHIAGWHHALALVAASAGRVTVLDPPRVRDAVLRALESRRELVQP